VHNSGGISPTDSVLARIKAPVAGFYGEDDARVLPTVKRAEATMERLKKTYDVADAWPRVIAYFNRYLK
jgi:hypothetical protein